MTTAACKKLFYECVVCVCLTLGIIFSLIAFLMALGFLMAVMAVSLHYQLIYTKLFGIQKKRLVHEDFMLKDTKLLS